MNKLSQSQEKAYNRLVEFIETRKHGNDFIILSGSPGTGKSFLTKELQNLYKGKILLTATTNKASTVIDGQTIYSLLNITLKNSETSAEQKLNLKYAKRVKNRIIIIDECSMISEDLYNIIQDYCYNCKIIFVGDWYQLPPVNSLFSIFNLGIEMLELKEIMRTDKDDIKELISNLKECVKNNTVFRDFKESKNIHIIKKENILDIVKDFKETEDVALFYTNPKVVELNSQIRTILKNKPPYFEEGDYILCKSSALDTSEDENSRLKIEAIHRIIKIINKDTHTLTMKLDNGCVYKTFIDPLNHQKVMKSVLNECYMKKNYKDYFEFMNTMLDARDIYAQTVHSSQGSTYNNVVVGLEDIYKYGKDCIPRLLYVAISRAKENVYILV